MKHLNMSTDWRQKWQQKRHFWVNHPGKVMNSLVRLALQWSKLLIFFQSSIHNFARSKCKQRVSRPCFKPNHSWPDPIINEINAALWYFRYENVVTKNQSIIHELTDLPWNIKTKPKSKYHLLIMANKPFETTEVNVCFPRGAIRWLKAATKKTKIW